MCTDVPKVFVFEYRLFFPRTTSTLTTYPARIITTNTTNTTLTITPLAMPPNRLTKITESHGILHEGQAFDDISVIGDINSAAITQIVVSYATALRSITVGLFLTKIYLTVQLLTGGTGGPLWRCSRCHPWRRCWNSGRAHPASWRVHHDCGRDQ